MGITEIEQSNDNSYSLCAVFQLFVLCIAKDRGRGIVLAVFCHRGHRVDDVELCLAAA